MKNNLKTHYMGTTIFTLVLAFGAVGVAENSNTLSEATIVKFIPDSLKVNPTTGEKQTYGSGIGVRTLVTNFSAQKTRDLFTVIQYNTDNDCVLRVLRKEGKDYKLMEPTKLKFPKALDGCLLMSTRDLAGDGNLELIVETLDGNTEGSPVILKWNGKALVDISPVETKNGETDRVFRQVRISAYPMRRKLLLLDIDPNDPFTNQRIFEMIDSEIKLNGTYDALSFVKGPSTNLKPAFHAPGTYVLEVKNLSDHHRTVRVEVSVNGVPILSPKDFCNGPPKSKDRDKDDGDDSNDDQMMGCEIKNDVYAIVPLRATNTMTVKIYGRSDSVLQVSLTKKP